MKLVNRSAVLLGHLLLRSVEQDEGASALTATSGSITYGDLACVVSRVAGGFAALGLRRHDRVGVYLPKSPENVVAMFAASFAGGAFVPINPILKSDQVCHILRDSEAKVLVTSSQRADALAAQFASLPELQHVVVVDSDVGPERLASQCLVAWSELQAETGLESAIGVETDMTAILYTSGSTGKPKGVVLSHRNIVAGAESVASYLGNHSRDCILSLLPLSFDAGFSQLTTAFSVGARVLLLDYLVAQDVVRLCEREAVTGITGVPPLWMQLVGQAWSRQATESVRYFANTGGKMPRDTLTKLRGIFPNARPFLMYGLTEAFRSTYLSPDEIDRRPDSIGKAIPNVEISVVRPDGSPCSIGEPGELVHRGPLVSLGYWKDPEKTAERFRPVPNQPTGLPHPEIAVWSGDTVRLDEENFLYFIGRKDDMIKTSGYRVSPTEIEEVAFESGLVTEAAAIGVPHATLGEAIVVVAKPTDSETRPDQLSAWFRQKLPTYMLPSRIEWRDQLPRNPNGKIDRALVRATFSEGSELQA